MLFMNEAEIDRARQLAPRARDAGSRDTLVKATQLLSDLRHLANEVSDGWCYWPKPCRAARGLQELIQAGLQNQPVTPDQLKKACGPIKAFMTREAKNLRGKTLSFPG